MANENIAFRISLMWKLEVGPKINNLKHEVPLNIKLVVPDLLHIKIYYEKDED
jgi:hypothetical protein